MLVSRNPHTHSPTPSSSHTRRAHLLQGELPPEVGHGAGDAGAGASAKPTPQSLPHPLAPDLAGSPAFESNSGVHQTGQEKDRRLVKSVQSDHLDYVFASCNFPLCVAKTARTSTRQRTVDTSRTHTREGRKDEVTCSYKLLLHTGTYILPSRDSQHPQELPPFIDKLWLLNDIHRTRRHPASATGHTVTHLPAAAVIYI